jgi:hypothetical protein
MPATNAKRIYQGEEEEERERSQKSKENDPKGRSSRGVV